MGASSWYYFTPHHPDPNAALQRLRQEVFEAGDYIDPCTAAYEYAAAFPEGQNEGNTEYLTVRQQETLQNLRSVLNNPILPPELRAMLQASFSHPSASVPNSQEFRAGTLEDLLEEAAEEGTHSILDITHVALRREFGAAVALTGRDLQRYLGTTRPGHDQAEAAALDIAERLGHWEACYFTVYQDGLPAEYVFIGCSGD